MKRILLTAVALATIGLPGQSAQAVLAYNSGELFLGFRGPTGVDSYLLNIGQFSQYTAGNGASFTLNIGNIGADLTAIYGAGWTTRSDVSWSVTGTPYNGSSNVVPTLYATRPRAFASLDTPTAPWKGRSPSAQTTTVSNFQALAGFYKQNGIATANSAVGTRQDSSLDNTYSFFLAPALDFGVWSTVEGNFTNGTAGSVLDLYRINPVFGQDADLLGSFRIDNAGLVTFTAVPEPSTLALLALGASLILYGTVSRRRAAAARSNS